MDEVITNLPQAAFTGLATKAAVTVTTASSWEQTQKEGETLATIMEVLIPANVGMKVPTRDLYTGDVNGSCCHATHNIGEVIFWSSLDHVLTTDLEELREVWLVMVNEPGKARAVTKGHACLKIVLNVVNKLCSWPLAKGVSSSESGMSKAHHGWNFFKSFYTEEMKEYFFDLDGDPIDEVFEDKVYRTVVYKDVYLGSTDFSNATDNMLHEVACILGNKWMRKCGIPPVLLGIVNATCYQPRWVYFSASGPLNDLGEDVDGIVRRIRLRRGVMMGDPLTKVVLHLINIIARTISNKLDDTAFLDKCFTNPHEIVEALRTRVNL
jgi:hypothetical protein